MACDIPIVAGCTPADVVGGVVGGVVGDAASSAWESVCKSFADAAVAMLKGFATAYAAFPNVDVSSDGMRSVYGISLGIAGFVAALLLLLQIARTVITHDGNALAQGFVGVGKAGLAFLLTLTVAGAGLVAADGLTDFIITQTFGSPQGLTTKLTALFEFDTLGSPALELLLALVGICLVAVLWFELLLRNAAFAVLVGTSPISAAGQVSEATKAWWSTLVSATIRLIILKPVIALVFAVGFGLFGAETKDLATLLSGMLVLLLAALAWPAIARFFTFAAAHSGGPSGLAALLGFAAGRSMPDTGGGAPGGVDPDQFGRHAENRTMGSFAARNSGAAETGASSAAGAAGGEAAGAGAAGAGAAGAGAAGAGAAAAGTAGVAVPLLLAVKGAQLAQRAANSLVGRMEQTAGHAGLRGAAPYAYPAGQPRYVPPTAGGPASSGPTTGDGGEQREPAPLFTQPSDSPTGPGNHDAPAPGPGADPGGPESPVDAGAPMAPAGPESDPPRSAAADPSAADPPAAEPPAPAAGARPARGDGDVPAGDSPPESAAPPPVVPRPRPADPAEKAKPASTPDSEDGDLS